MTRRISTAAMLGAAALSIALAMPSAAQQPAPAPAPSPQATPAPPPGDGPPGPSGRGFGPGGPRWGDWSGGMMMGPGMMGRGGWGGMCNPRAAGFAEWRLERLERALRPNEAQKVKLNDLKAASAKAAETIAAACPREFPISVPGRLELMEKRMESMLLAIKTVRPAFDALYASLDEEQKARLNRAGPRDWGWRRWRWRDR